MIPFLNNPPPSSEYEHYTELELTDYSQIKPQDYDEYNTSDIKYDDFDISHERSRDVIIKELRGGYTATINDTSGFFNEYLNYRRTDIQLSMLIHGTSKKLLMQQLKAMTATESGEELNSGLDYLNNTLRNSQKERKLLRLILLAQGLWIGGCGIIPKKFQERLNNQGELKEFWW